MVHSPYAIRGLARLETNWILCIWLLQDIFVVTIRNQNVKVYRANSASISIAVTQADGTAYDPSLNAQFRYRVALTSHADDSEALVKKSLGAGIVTITGGVAVTINPEDSDFAPGVYYHELQVIDGVDKSTAMTGAFVIKKAISMGDTIHALQGNLVIDRKLPTRTP